jgi:hypothetical protein
MKSWGNNERISAGFSSMLATTLMAGNIEGTISDDDEIVAFKAFLNTLSSGGEVVNPGNKYYNCCHEK